MISRVIGTLGSGLGEKHGQLQDETGTMVQVAPLAELSWTTENVAASVCFS